MSAANVELRSVSKRYGQIAALKEASLTLAPGRFLVLLGPSGSGKTTLIRCLAGIERPTAGEIEIGGRLVASDRVHVAPDKRDLGMVFQDFALWPHLTVSQNVAFPLRRRSLSRVEGLARAAAMLDKVGLAAYGERYPHELSGGQQQRVALARALVARPGVLLFDEPLSALDANLRERLRVEIGTLSRDHGATAVYITHDQAEAFALGDEIGVLENGELVQIGAPETIYRTPASPFIARFTGVSGTLHGRLLTGPRSCPGRGRVLIPSDDPRRQLELAATVLAPLPAGAAVQVLLRPTAARIVRRGARAASLRAVVRDGAYQGRGYVYVLEAGAGVSFTGIFDRRSFPRGTEVDVYIDPGTALVFGEDPHTPSPPLAGAAVLAGTGAGVPARRDEDAGRPIIHNDGDQVPAWTVNGPFPDA
ncbi:ABC transporter ATP-binding protein [Conexibacter sp. DBS9H8]|uniref:ABC transporter ATP-binding protein n=1 Tax=Conexibacter sp. DBS9H8 TaxID=2937801 RepID=UPI00200DAC7C|nr:ABC transporter ATP-binding protein [Conexibacter sp. DBS9H8]